MAPQSTRIGTAGRRVPRHSDACSSAFVSVQTHPVGRYLCERSPDPDDSAFDGRNPVRIDAKQR
jgi:hypothetical protein